MGAGGELVPDWRDAAAYEPLLEADRSLFAWEWLRRNPDYRAAAERALEEGGSRIPAGSGQAPRQWGLHAFEPPSVTVPDARPIWCAEVHPYVLAAEAAAADDEVFALDRYRAISTLITTADGRERLLISDGCRAIRIDVLAGTIASGPVELQFRIIGIASAERPVLTLRRLLSIWRTGQFSGLLHPREARARRWILMLRTHDALTAGASQRAIAAELLGSGATRQRWRVEAPSVRSQVQRLVRAARWMADGGFWQLLT